MIIILVVCINGVGVADVSSGIDGEGTPYCY